MASEDDRSKCPICAYSFTLSLRMPKLLPCQHTICCVCIEKILMATRVPDGRFIKCPLCTKVASVPQNGIKGFLDNYFVTVQTHVYMSTCDICEEASEKISECSVCNSAVCVKCNITHQENHNKNRGHESDSASSNSEGNPALLRFARRRYQKIIPTFFIASHVKTFTCEVSQRIRKILPIGTVCWVLNDTPLVYRFDSSGRVRRKEWHDQNIIDMCSNGRNSIIFVDTCGSIMEVNLVSGTKQYICSVPSVSIVTSLFVNPGNFILVAVQDETKSESKIMKYDFRQQKFLNTDSLKENGESLRYVTAIEVHPKTENRYICDYDQQCIIIITEQSTCILRYEGKLSLPKIEHTDEDFSIIPCDCKFRPRTICLDQNCILVYDLGTKSIHVIDDCATVLGVVFPDSLDPLGDSNSLSVDRGGNLWVGDRQSGKVKMFRFDRYLNIYDNDDDAVSSDGPLSLVCVSGPDGRTRPVGLRLNGRDINLDDSGHYSVLQGFHSHLQHLLQQHEALMDQIDPGALRYMQEEFNTVVQVDDN